LLTGSVDFLSVGFLLLEEGICLKQFIN